jgi:hypothetical protein
MSPVHTCATRSPALLDSRLDAARHACQAALEAEPLAGTSRFIAAERWTGERWTALVAAALRGAPDLFRLQDEVNQRLELDPADCAIERVLVLRTALDNLERIPGLPVDESVKHLICRDITWYADPRRLDAVMFSCRGPNFSSRLKVASLVRFPAGQSEWEVSGFPRSWLAKVSIRDVPRTLRFLMLQLKGFGPLFVGHLGVRRRIPFLTEREARLGTYRSALALEQQPDIRGMMAVSWLHSRETFRVSPHLAFMNATNEEMGGLYVDLGPAPEDEGFLHGDPRRIALYRDGEYKPTHAAIICSRAQALEWMRRNRHLETDLIPR